MARGKKNPREAEAFYRSPWVKAQIQRTVEKTLAEIRQKSDWEVWVREENPLDVVFHGTRLLWIVDRAAVHSRIDLDQPDMRIIAGAASAIVCIGERPQELHLHRASVQSGFQAAERLWPSLDIWALANAEMEFHAQAKSPDGILLSHFSFFARREMTSYLPGHHKHVENSSLNS